MDLNIISFWAFFFLFLFIHYIYLCNHFIYLFIYYIFLIHLSIYFLILILCCSHFLRRDTDVGWILWNMALFKCYACIIYVLKFLFSFIIFSYIRFCCIIDTSKYYVCDSCADPIFIPWQQFHFNKFLLLCYLYLFAYWTLRSGYLTTNTSAAQYWPSWSRWIGK